MAGSRSLITFNSSFIYDIIPINVPPKFTDLLCRNYCTGEISCAIKNFASNTLETKFNPRFHSNKGISFLHLMHVTYAARIRLLSVRQTNSRMHFIYSFLKIAFSRWQSLSVSSKYTTLFVLSLSHYIYTVYENFFVLSTFILLHSKKLLTTE